MKYALKYSWAFGRRLTLRKLNNYRTLVYSFWLSNRKKEVIHRGNPASLGIEPTTACNLRCSHCVSGNRSFTRPTGKMNPELYQALIDQTYQDLIFLILYFQGEPYLNPQFLDMVSYAHAKGIFTMTSSNGHFLDSDRSRYTVESGLDSMIISLDGTTQETYEKYRKEGNIKTVIEGIRQLVFWKKKLKSLTPLINLQFIVFRHNEHEISTIKQLGKKLGVDKVSIKTAQLYDPEMNLDLIPSIEKYSRYRKDGDHIDIDNSLENKCWRLWQGAEVTHDGRILPCCFDKDAKYTMGIFNPADTTSFNKIWHESANYKNFRQQILNGRKNIEMCRNCTEGTKVWI